MYPYRRELQDSLATYLCSSTFLIHRRIGGFVVVGVGGGWARFCFHCGQSIWINIMIAGIRDRKRRKQFQSITLWILSSVIVSFEKFCLTPE